MLNLQIDLYNRAYANPKGLSQHKEQSTPKKLQGLWQNGALSFTLTAKGELVLKQGALITELKGTAQQEFKGYWWSKDQRLCFLLDLASRCYEFRSLHKQGILKIKLGKRWLELIKEST